jgi:DNA integrity scanning protein DisA with diadenylate cyclase activity
MTTVTATCLDCGDTHQLGDRILVTSEDGLTTSTTACPLCDDTGYKTDTTDSSVKSEAERILDTVKPADGVGDKNAANIVESFNSYAGLASADVSRLTDVEGVGRKTAEAIVERT